MRWLLLWLILELNVSHQWFEFKQRAGYILFMIPRLEGYIFIRFGASVKSGYEIHYVLDEKRTWAVMNNAGAMTQILSSGFIFQFVFCVSFQWYSIIFEKRKKK